MNTNLDDPKLTAYALDELAGAEKTKMATAVAASPATQEFVRQLREISGALKSEYEAERAKQPALPTNILPLPQRDEPWSVSRRLALAAAIALLALIGAIAVGTMKRDVHSGWRQASNEKPGDVEAIDLPALSARPKDALALPRVHARTKIVSGSYIPTAKAKGRSQGSRPSWRVFLSTLRVTLTSRITIFFPPPATRSPPFPSTSIPRPMPSLGAFSKAARSRLTTPCESRK